jgi:hypothetical protein
MKPELIESANRIATEARHASHDRWGIWNLADGALDLFSGLIELLFESLV